jgi:creatinine amidohydrolase
MKWQAMTSAEIAAVDRNTPVVLGIAAIEQHGPHLPINTDVIIGQHFLDAVDTRLGPDVCILPIVQVCCSEHHMDFAGTLTVRHETMLAYIGDILDSVVAHGFRNLVLFNSHGGNQAIGQVILEKFGVRHPDHRIVLLTWWRLAAPELSEICESGFGGVGHACEFETSLVMLARPDDVRRDRIPGRSNVATYPWAQYDMLVGARGSLYRGMREMSGGSGVVGDPTKASVEKGERIAAAVVKILCDIVRSLDE